jgi:hypothetical protein
MRLFPLFTIKRLTPARCACAQRHCARRQRVVPFLLATARLPQQKAGSIDSAVDQPCVKGQNLALSFRTAMLS